MKKATLALGVIAGLVAFTAAGIYANGEYQAKKVKDRQVELAHRSIECDAARKDVLRQVEFAESETSAGLVWHAEHDDNLSPITRKTLLEVSKQPKTWESIPVESRYLRSVGVTVPDRSARDAAVWSVARQLCMVL